MKTVVAIYTIFCSYYVSHDLLLSQTPQQAEFVSTQEIKTLVDSQLVAEERTRIKPSEVGKNQNGA